MDLNTKVLFKKNTPTGSNISLADSYATNYEAYGQLKPLSGRRLIQGGDVTTDNSFELIVRYDGTFFSDLKADSKVEIDSVLYSVQTWEKMNNKKYYIRLIINK